VVLHRYQPAHGAGERDVVRNAEHSTEAPYRPTWRTDRQERRQVEAERYDSVLRRLADPEVEQLVSYLGAHGHEDIGVLGKDAFELDEGPLLRTSEVTLQDMAMERVDQPWAPAAGRGQGRQPPYRAGLGHMRVDQLCAGVAQQPADHQKAPEVSSRPDWAHERDVAHRDIWVGELSFSLCRSASGENGRELGR